MQVPRVNRKAGTLFGAGFLIINGLYFQVFNNAWLIGKNVVICLCKKFVIMQKPFTKG